MLVLFLKNIEDFVGIKVNRLLLDNHKLLYHLKPLNKWLKGEEIYPLYCSISLTRMCNSKCIFCVYDSFERSRIFLDKNKILNTIKELSCSGLKAVFYSGEGEPLMHKDAPEIIMKTKKLGIDCAINTNGVLLDRVIAEGLLKSLTFIRISLNGCSSENYRDIHRSTIHVFDRILDNIKQAVDIKRKNRLPVTVGIQCIILKENIDYLIDLTNILKNIGVDYLSFKPFLPIDIAKYRTNLNYEDSKVKKILKECEGKSTNDFHVVVRWNSLIKIAKRNYSKCLSLPFMVEIDAKGDVYPCGVLMGRKEFCYGNIYSQSYKELMQSRRYKTVLSKITNELNVHKCMPNCRNDAVNRFLYSIKHPPAHVNFI